MVLYFEWGGGLLSAVSCRARTAASTRRLWFSSHKSCGVNCISKQSAIALAFSDGRNLRPEVPWIAVDALGPSLSRRHFAMSHIVWSVASALPIFVSHRSSVSLRVIRLIAFETQWTAVLHAGSRVSCHNFLSLCLCFNFPRTTYITSAPTTQKTPPLLLKRVYRVIA
jgi:hypothetical protein